MRPEARVAARSEALKEAKEKKAAAQSAKKAEKAKSATAGGKSRILSKQGAKGAAVKPAASKRF
jgi:large subunit ribosomal protein L24e